MNKKIISYIGLVIGTVLLLTGGGLFYLKEKKLKTLKNAADNTVSLPKNREPDRISPKKVEVIVSKESNIGFMYSNSKPKAVYLIGDFNKWSKTANLMEKDNNHKWTTMLKLRPGTYNYCFLVGGKWTIDPNNKKAAVYKGKKVSVLTVNPLK